MKRFWVSADAQDGEGYLLTLDGKPMRLPGGGSLLLPFPALAQAVAAEWEAAPHEFTMDDLPLTRLAATAGDQVRRMRQETINSLIAYGLNDLLCYRADDPGLAGAQMREWQPWLDWAATELGVTLSVTSGILPIDQPPECTAAFTARLQMLDEYQLAGLGVIVPALGSLVLGLAVHAGALEPAASVECANLDEFWQESQWGSDTESAVRRRGTTKDIEAAARFMRLALKAD